MSNQFEEDIFLTIDDGDKYFDYLDDVQKDVSYLHETLETIINENVFNNRVYVEVTGLIKYSKNRLFPLLSSFLAEDENFSNDIYIEFMDIHLMLNFLFDKLQYELDEVLIKSDLTVSTIEDTIDKFESVNYYLTLIEFQISLFLAIFDLKLALIKNQISEDEFMYQIEQLHKILDE